MPGQCEREWSASAVMSFLQDVLDWCLPLIADNRCLFYIISIVLLLSIV